MVKWANTFEKELDRIVSATLDARAVAVRNEALALESRRLKRRTGTYNRSFRIIKGALKRTIRNEAPYAMFIEQGTGLYGPRRRRITPKPGNRFLRFVVNGRVVYARSVSGIKPRHILADALRKANQ